MPAVLHAASAPPTIPRRLGAAARGLRMQQARHRRAQLVARHRLVQQHEPAVLQPAGPSRGRVARDQHRGNRRVVLVANARDRSDAVLVAVQVQVADQQGRPDLARCQARDRVIDRRGRDDPRAPALEQHRHAGADRAFVVDHDHEVRGGRRLVDGDLVGGGARLHGRVQPHQLQFEAWPRPGSERSVSGQSSSPARRRTIASPRPTPRSGLRRDGATGSSRRIRAPAGRPECRARCR